LSLIAHVLSCLLVRQARSLFSTLAITKNYNFLYTWLKWISSEDWRQAF
jgi:hypothetical protein